MNEILMNMGAEKRDRIINSALMEFSKNGFKKASTNKIVVEAGISKGLLFHYFINKKGLYDHLEKFSIETVMKNITDKLNWDESDFFERVKQIVLIKIQVTAQYPYIYDFMIKTYENMTADDIFEYRENLSPGLLQKVYTYNIDYSKFKDSMDIKKVTQIIQWSLEGYGKDFYDKLQKTKEPINYEELIEDFEKLICILKEAFYK